MSARARDRFQVAGTTMELFPPIFSTTAVELALIIGVVGHLGSHGAAEAAAHTLSATLLCR